MTVDESNSELATKKMAILHKQESVSKAIDLNQQIIES